jgi:hypothetical protein
MPIGKYESVRSQVFITLHATASFFSIPPRRNALTTGLVHAVWAANKTI